MLVDGEDQTSRFTVASGEAAAVLEALADGPHSISARATDRAGNATTASATFRVDTTKPAVAIQQPVAGTTTNAGTVTVIGTVTDASPVSVTVNGVAAAVSGGQFPA